MENDPFDLSRFVSAQDPVWNDVVQELKAGRKETHWMWFVFPQLGTLGRSSLARHYGLSGLDEATAYLAHPVLDARLKEACAILLLLDRKDAREIFGTVDAAKLRSCLTLFAKASGGDRIFLQCLQQYFEGHFDELTTSQLGFS
ncbi:MAG TPA: DUF1810 domain-containing protein [Ramlibacter sp.]|nr:DUF1810 domain-containing protein [Ramlibacter sp.]